MSEKILVADDSPTIQKVVGITLASTDFQLSQAQTVEELFNFLDADNYDLILLDFNLSEDQEGYDLCREIKGKSPNSKIIVMLGTFDSVDEGKLSEVGVSEKVIKPFESTKFIQKIKDTLAGDSFDSGFSPLDMPDGEDDIIDVEEPTYLTEVEVNEDLDEEEDEWSMSGPSESSNYYDEDEDSDEGYDSLNNYDSSENELHTEMAGWGMEVPSVIGRRHDQELMPPKMGEDGHSSEFQSDETGEWDTHEMGFSKEKSDDDYSFEDNVNSFEGSSSESEDVTQNTPRASLISLEELVDDEDDGIEDEDIDDTDPQIIIEQNEDDPSLEAELSGDMGVEEFWAADESYDLEEEGEENNITINPKGGTSEEEMPIEDHYSLEVGPKIEKDVSEVGNRETFDALNELAKQENEVGPKIEEVGPKMENHSSFNNIDTNDLVRQVIEQLRPTLRDLVQEVLLDMSKETIEGVAWEIIPDLAENLIRSEVENLSKKVQSKHSLS